MASLATHLINPLLRIKIKSKLAGETSLASIRRAFETKLPVPRGVQFTSAIIGHVSGEWAEPMDGMPMMTLLYLHGGAYLGCSAKTHRPITGGFARRGIRVFAPNYRLAPEYPYPAAVEDALATYHGLIEQGCTPDRLAIAGDSAGGGLALAVLLKAKDEGFPLPARVVLFSPWVDLKGGGASVAENSARDPMIVGDKITKGAALYLAGADPEEPFASPLYGDLSALPPTLIHVGSDEVLRDDAVRLDAKIRAAHGISLLRIWPAVPHAWPIFNVILPEGRQALDESAVFIRYMVPRSTDSDG